MIKTFEALDQVTSQMNKLAVSRMATEVALSALIATGTVQYLDEHMQDTERQTVAETARPTESVIVPPVHPSHAPPATNHKPKTAPKHLAVAPKPTDVIRPVHWQEVTLPENPTTLSGDALLHLANLATSDTLTDISHPQCEGKKSQNTTYGIDMATRPEIKIPAKNHGLDGVPLAILGVNGHRPMIANRCLKDLASAPQNYDFYILGNNPGLNVMRQYAKRTPYHCASKDNLCIAKAYGALAVNHDLQLIKKAGLHAPHGYFWIDVEKPSVMWQKNGKENRAVLQGMIDYLTLKFPRTRIGFYSAPTSIVHPDRLSQWDQITSYKEKSGRRNYWRNGYDAWIATGAGQHKDRALKACETRRKGFTDGRVVLSQYTRIVGDIPVDADALCPRS